MKRAKKIIIVTLCFLLSLPPTVASAADYTVTKEDTLESLSTLFKTKVTTLRRCNNFDEISFTPGNTIYVPAHVYTVKSGDSLYKIATKFKISLTNLKKANNKSGNLIVKGEKLLIPGVKAYRKSDTVIKYTNAEVDLLARLIEAEASGESLQAKTAVGAVAVNRVQSGEWASTITKVINQKYGSYYQFTPVKIGTIKNTPSAASIRAAWTALFGSDPSNHAIFYYDTSSKNEWIQSKKQTARIGNLIFAK